MGLDGGLGVNTVVESGGEILFVDEWIGNYVHLYGDPSGHLPELKLAFIRLALEEQTRREIAASARSAAAAASKVVVIAVLTLAVAVTTLIVAIAR